MNYNSKFDEILFVEEIDENETYDLEVDSEDHTFFQMAFLFQILMRSHIVLFPITAHIYLHTTPTNGLWLF